jgi:hypothetical protein
MKSLLITLSFLVMGSAVAGPSVSGGIAFYENYESCTNKKAKTSFRVAAVASPTLVFGTMVEGTVATTLNCKDGNNRRNATTGEEIVWDCNEQRAGEGQLHVIINRNDMGIKYATVYRKDILNRDAKLSTMACDQQVSNR